MEKGEGGKMFLETIKALLPIKKEDSVRALKSKNVSGDTVMHTIIKNNFFEHNKKFEQKIYQIQLLFIQAFKNSLTKIVGESAVNSLLSIKNAEGLTPLHLCVSLSSSFNYRSVKYFVTHDTLVTRDRFGFTKFFFTIFFNN